MHIEFRRSPLPLLPGSVKVDEPAEALNVNLQVHMTGVLIIMVIAPDDDQKLFPLVLVNDRAKMMERPWVQTTMTQLQPALNKIIEQSLVKMRLFPAGNVIQPGCGVDQNGKLVYTFQVPVQNFPAGAAPVQQGGPVQSDGATVQ